MIHYIFKDNNSKSSKSENLVAIHYCKHCNTELIGEWELYYNNKHRALFLKDNRKTKEFFEFAQLSTCPICGGKFDAVQEHHFTNHYINKSKYVSKEYYFSNVPLSPVDVQGLNVVPQCKCYSLKDFPNALKSQFEEGKEIITKYGKGVLKYFFDDGSFKVHFFDNNTESILSFFEYHCLKLQKETIETQMVTFINRCILESETSSVNAAQINDDCNLKGYLEQLFLIEKNVFSLSERLKELYSLNYFAEKDALASEKLMLLKGKEAVKKASKDYEDLKTKSVENTIKIEDFPIAYPNEPQKPKEPKKPILATPGFFNKKRILAENALLTEKYEKELEAYNLAVEKYEVDLKQHKETIISLEKQREEKYKLAVETAKETLEKEIGEAKTKYEDLLKEQKEYELSAKDTPTSEKAQHLLLKEEIAIVEELLKKFYKAQFEMYSCGVIFEKYRNFVAVSSFYEYISSGRCESLEGANGAYNLFENEIRMNMVICQLNQVVESLEEIKQNQYMIYSAIQETNRHLETLNVTTNDMLSAIGELNEKSTSMESYLSEISHNTRVTVYNTEKTAFYAKKNAELTNALGFLVALK